MACERYDVSTAASTNLDLQGRKALGAADLLFNLQALDGGGELAEDLVGLLVVLDLSCDKLGKVAQRLGGVDDLVQLKSALV